MLAERTILSPVLWYFLAMSDCGRSMVKVRDLLSVSCPDEKLIDEKELPGTLMVPDFTMPPSGSTYLIGNEEAFAGIDAGIS